MLIFLSSLLDNWVNLGGFGLKVFDLAFITIAFFVSFQKRKKFKLQKNDVYLFYAFLFYFFLSLLFDASVLIRNIYILVLFLFSYLFGKNINPKIVIKTLRINLIIWVTGFYFQFFYFKIFGKLLNLTFFTTQTLRVNIFDSLFGVRYTSFAIEPNSFVTVVSLLLLAFLSYEYDHKNFKFRKLSYLDINIIILTIIATYISGSFFSYITIASFGILFLPSFFRIFTKYKKIKISSLIIITLLFSILIQNFEKLNNNIMTRLASERLVSVDVADELNLSKNRSFYDRTARLFSNTCLQNIKSPEIILGTGLDTVNYHPKCGVNLISYLLLNFGILGNILLFFILYRRLNLPFLIWIVLTSPFLFPMIGSAFFPLILGIMIKKNK